MASQDYTIELLLKANNQLSKELEKIEWQIGKLDKQVNNTNNSVNSAFSKISWFISKWLIIGAITKVTKKIADLGIAMEPIEYSFNRLSQSAWIAGDEMLDAMRKASRWTVSDYKLMEQANKAYSLWVVNSVDDMTTLIDIARLKGKAFNRTMDEALNDIVTWLGRTSPLILDNLWITINQAEAQEKYASEIWKTADQLTEAEKKQALVNAVVEEWKRELEAAWEQAETTQDKIARLQTSFTNIATEVWKNVLPQINNLFDKMNDWIDENRDTIVAVLNEVMDVVWVALNNARELVKDVVENVSGIFNSAISTISSWVKDSITLIASWFKDGYDNMEENTRIWLDWMKWDWSDFFYRVQLWITGISDSLSLVMNAIWSVWKTVTTKWFWKWLFQSWDSRMYDENWEKFSRLERVWNSFKATWNYIKDAFKDTRETVKEQADKLYKDIEDIYVNRVDKITGGGKTKNFTDLVLWWGWWWWGGWNNKTLKSTKDAIKEIKDQYELLTYSVDEQYKKIQELNKERKEWYDELSDKFKEADKNVKDLSKSVWDLKQKLADLNKDETSDIATEFVNARKELQKMERDYAWIWEVAKQYSMEYLENFTHWWIGKYDIDALIQYKKYSDEMASVYDWMNDSERKAMDEQIAYQEWYQSLNGIEKIKEDYRIKREEIQWELNEKMSALRQEELKRAEIDKQMKQYQKEWLAAIDKEIVKYWYMVAEKKRYEKEYMDQLEIDYKRQQQMYDDLIRKAKELAKVRSETWWPDWRSTRANGWPVYSWQQYLVWEHWPELFIPSQNWSIVKNEDLWKWQEFTINVNMWWVVVNDWQDTQQMAEEIANTITRQLELYKKGIY